MSSAPPLIGPAQFRQRETRPAANCARRWLLADDVSALRVRSQKVTRAPTNHDAPPLPLPLSLPPSLPPSFLPSFLPSPPSLPLSHSLSRFLPLSPLPRRDSRAGRRRRARTRGSRRPSACPWTTSTPWRWCVAARRVRRLSRVGAPAPLRRRGAARWRSHSVIIVSAPTTTALIVKGRLRRPAWWWRWRAQPGRPPVDTCTRARRGAGRSGLRPSPVTASATNRTSEGRRAAARVRA